MTSKVLLLEQSEAVTRSIMLSLGANGYEVLPAATVEQARKLLETSSIGLVIADQNILPEEWARLMENYSGSGLFSPVPLILLTSEEGMLSRETITFAKDWIIKPFSANRLLKAVNSFTIH